MLFTWAKLVVVFALVTGRTVLQAEAPLFSDEFIDLNQWSVEQMPGGKVEAHEGRLIIRDKGGCTVWFRPKLKAPVSIRYDAVVRSTGRVSDLNCFWMASNPSRPSALLDPRSARTGAFAEYDALQTYYVGYGGNSNSTTRFRRYLGGGSKPLLPEHDLREKRFLLEADRIYHLELIAQGGVAKFLRDGEVIFDFQDPHPLTEGWFGLRTVDAQIEVRNFRVVSLPAPSSVTAR